MATVVNLPRSGRSRTIEQAGKGIGGIVSALMNKGKQQDRNKLIADIFDNIQGGSVKTGADIIQQSGTSIDDKTLASLFASLDKARNRKSATQVTGRAEILDEGGKGTGKFTNVKFDSADFRREQERLRKGGLNLGISDKSGGKASDKQLGISAFLNANKLKSTGINRTKANRFLNDQDRIDKQIGTALGSREIEPGIFEFANPANRKQASRARELVKDILLADPKDPMSLEKATSLAIEKARVEIPDEEDTLIAAPKQEKGFLESLFGGDEPVDNVVKATAPDSVQPAADAPIESPAQAKSKIGSVAGQDLIMLDSDIDILEGLDDVDKEIKFIKGKFPNMKEGDIKTFLLESGG